MPHHPDRPEPNWCAVHRLALPCPGCDDDIARLLDDPMSYRPSPKEPRGRTRPGPA